jgi:hypothetical protein
MQSILSGLHSNFKTVTPTQDLAQLQQQAAAQVAAREFERVIAREQ